MPPADRQALKQKFVEFLGKRDLRMTSQRDAILQSVFGTEEHFTADQLLEWARKIDASVSRATVYRTLPLLTECGLLREMDFGKDHKFYDPNYNEHPNHSHIICQDCERIVEFDSEKIVKLEDEISNKLGFKVRSQKLQITASCEEFKARGACAKKRH